MVEAATTTASSVNQPLTHPVCFVGGGRGAADLLTLRAAERIRQADVLIWTDSLVCPQITALAPDHCERIRTSTLTLDRQALTEILIEKVNEKSAVKKADVKAEAKKPVAKKAATKKPAAKKSAANSTKK